MRTASILLALVVVLGFLREAGAYSTSDRFYPDYTVQIGEYRIGFRDHRHGDTLNFSVVDLGPFGEYHKVPFTATQGLAGFCFIVAMLIIVPVALTVRWKRKGANRL
jgi:hypothetical protein